LNGPCVHCGYCGRSAGLDVDINEAPGPGGKSGKGQRFAVFTIGAVFFGWAWLVPGINGTWLNRAVILMVEMFVVVSLFGLELDKALRREPEWTRSIRECIPWLAGAGSCSSCLCALNGNLLPDQFSVQRT